MNGTNLEHLIEWIAVNRPDLSDRLDGLMMVDGLAILNEETGLSVGPWSPIQDTALQLLKALKSKHLAAIPEPDIMTLGIRGSDITVKITSEVK